MQKLWKAKWRIWTNDSQLQDVIFLGLFFAPILAVIVMHSVLYNGWRQMYFIYPAFLLIVMRGFVFLWSACGNKLLVQKITHVLIAIALGASMSWTAGWMIHAHPFQNLYFNALAGKNWAPNFEVDYWALTQQRVIKGILKSDPRPVIRVAGIWQDVLPKAERARIAKVDFDSDAEYVVEGAGSNFAMDGEITIDGQVVGSFSRRKGELSPLLPIALNEVIRFAPQDKGVAYLLALGNQAQIGWGWSNPEGWGVWSDGYQAKLLLPLPQQTPNQLILNVRPFVSAVQPSQDVKIRINQQLAGTYRLSTPDSQITIPLTAKMRERNYVEVLFQFTTSNSPKQLGLGEDERRLAIGLVSAQFK